jgi:hypothetical protein
MRNKRFCIWGERRGLPLESAAPRGVALERDRCIVLLLKTTVCEIARCVDARVTHEDSLIPPTAHPADRESNALLPASPIVNASGPQQVTDAPSSSNSCCSTQLAWDESLDDSSSAALEPRAIVVGHPEKRVLDRRRSQKIFLYRTYDRLTNSITVC